MQLVALAESVVRKLSYWATEAKGFDFFGPPRPRGSLKKGLGEDSSLKLLTHINGIRV